MPQNNNLDRRRSDDHRIDEIHAVVMSMNGTLSALVQEVKDHIKVDEAEHKKIASHEERIPPLESFHASFKKSAERAEKWAIVLIAPIAVSAAYKFWEWLRELRH